MAMARLQNFLTFFTCKSNRSQESSQRPQESIVLVNNDNPQRTALTERNRQETTLETSNSTMIQTVRSLRTQINQLTTFQSLQANSIHNLQALNRISTVPVTKISKSPYVRTNTVHQKENIQMADFKPEQSAKKKELKYTCPICFRYFSHMLKADCCGNYICYYCVQELNKFIYLKKVEQAVCHFCKKENFCVSDVKADDQLRRYTDSPFASATKTLSSAMKLKESKLNYDSMSNQNLQAIHHESALTKSNKFDTHNMNVGFNNLQKASTKTQYIQSPKFREECQENVKHSDEEQKVHKGPKKLAFPKLNTYSLTNLSQAENLTRHQITENRQQFPRGTITMIHERANEEIDSSRIALRKSRVSENPKRNHTDATGNNREVCRLADKFLNLSDTNLEIHEGVQQVPIMPGINKKKGLR